MWVIALVRGFICSAQLRFYRTLLAQLPLTISRLVRYCKNYNETYHTLLLWPSESHCDVIRHRAVSLGCSRLPSLGMMVTAHQTGHPTWVLPLGLPSIV